MNETMLLLIGVVVFVAVNNMLKKVWRGREITTYEQAQKDQTIVTGECVKSWIDDDGSDWRGDDRHYAIYKYEVNGKKYKRKMEYKGGTITLYYKKNRPGYAVTKGEAHSIDHTLKRILVSLVAAIIVINVLK